MAKKTILEEVNARIKEMQESKAAQLATIQEKQEESRGQLEAAELAMKHATAEMDVDSYEKAMKARDKAKIAFDMYRGRYEQIMAQEYISEAESDKIIDSLLDYENQLDEDFKAAVAEPLRKLAELHKAYIEEISSTENTIGAWTSGIHANYRSSGTIYADGSNRSDHPVPVRLMRYTGCAEATKLGEYLKKAEALHQD